MAQLCFFFFITAVSLLLFLQSDSYTGILFFKIFYHDVFLFLKLFHHTSFCRICSCWSKLWNAGRQPPTSIPGRDTPKIQKHNQMPSFRTQLRRPLGSTRLGNRSHPRNTQPGPPTARRRHLLRQELGQYQHHPLLSNCPFQIHISRKRSHPRRLSRLCLPSNSKSRPGLERFPAPLQYSGKHLRLHRGSRNFVPSFSGRILH